MKEVSREINEVFAIKYFGLETSRKMKEQTAIEMERAKSENRIAQEKKHGREDFWGEQEYLRLIHLGTKAQTLAEVNEFKTQVP